MDSQEWKRHGILAALAGIALTLLGERLPEPLGPLLVENAVFAHALAVGGILAVALSLLLDQLAADPCRQCGRRSVRGSALCAAHKRELSQASHVAMARQRRDRRGY